MPLAKKTAAAVKVPTRRMDEHPNSPATKKAIAKKSPVTVRKVAAKKAPVKKASPARRTIPIDTDTYETLQFALEDIARVAIGADLNGTYLIVTFDEDTMETEGYVQVWHPKYNASGVDEWVLVYYDAEHELGEYKYPSRTSGVVRITNHIQHMLTTHGK